MWCRSRGSGRRNKIYDPHFLCVLRGHPGDKKTMADQCSLWRGKECCRLGIWITIATYDLAGEVLDARMDEESWIPALHFTHHPLFALFVSDIGPPCRQGHTDCLFREKSALGTNFGFFARNTSRARHIEQAFSTGSMRKAHRNHLWSCV